MSDAFELERQNNDALLRLHYLASEKNDPHVGSRGVKVFVFRFTAVSSDLNTTNRQCLVF